MPPGGLRVKRLGAGLFGLFALAVVLKEVLGPLDGFLEVPGPDDVGDAAQSQGVPTVVKPAPRLIAVVVAATFALLAIAMWYAVWELWRANYGALAHYLVVASGRIEIDGEPMGPLDGVAISGAAAIEISASEDSELVLVEAG